METTPPNLTLLSNHGLQKKGHCQFIFLAVTGSEAFRDLYLPFFEALKDERKVGVKMSCPKGFGWCFRPSVLLCFSGFFGLVRYEAKMRCFLYKTS